MANASPLAIGWHAAIIDEIEGWRLKAIWLPEVEWKRYVCLNPVVMVPSEPARMMPTPRITEYLKAALWRHCTVRNCIVHVLYIRVPL